jgi:hypothetical protein
MARTARPLLAAVLPLALLGAAPRRTAAPAPSPTPASAAPRAEARALWVNRWEYSSPAGVAKIMENA